MGLRDCISRSDLSMSSSWLSGHPAPPESGPELSKETLRGVTQSPSSRFSGGAKNVMKVVGVVYAKFCGTLHRARESLLWGYLRL